MLRRALLNHEMVRAVLTERQNEIVETALIRGRVVYEVDLVYNVIRPICIIL